MIDKSVLHSVTSDPGVYLFLDQADKVLYVGKAKNLRRRLASYFSDNSSDDRPQIPHLMASAKALKTLVVSTEFEALLLESQLIKLHQPKYNVLLRSDLSHACLHLDLNCAWPILEIVRSKDAASCQGKVYGPFLSSVVAEEILELLQDLYGLRRCSLAEMQRRSRPCLWYHIKKCSAPCRLKEGDQGFSWKHKRAGSKETAQQLREEYIESAKAVDLTLSGQTEALEAFMEKEIEKACQRLDFEKAQKIFHRKKQLKELLQAQCIDHPKEQMDADIFSFSLRDGLIVRIKVRAGRLVERENYWIQEGIFSEGHLFSIQDLLQSLIQIYLGEEEFLLSGSEVKKGKKKKKREVVIDLDQEERAALSSSLKQISSETEYSVYSTARSLRKRWHQIAEKNLESLLFAQKSKRERGSDPGVLGEQPRAETAEQPAELGACVEQEKRGYCEQARQEWMAAIAKRFSLARTPQRIECFDISHLGGSETVGSCVVYEQLRRDRASTRRYQIESGGGDDLKAMGELLERRLKSLLEHPERKRPDLWLIDGARLHLEVAKKVLDRLHASNESGFARPSVMSIAKESGKHTKAGTRELLYTEKGRCFELALDDRDLLLFQRIRDETHDVAIQYQRMKRAQKIRYSSLNQIEGIGPKKKKKLLEHFGTISALRSAGVEEIASISGISRENALAIVRFYQEKR